MSKSQSLERKKLRRRPRAATPANDPSEAQLEELQAMEREMDTILVAYTCGKT